MAAEGLEDLSGNGELEHSSAMEATEAPAPPLSQVPEEMMEENVAGATAPDAAPVPVPDAQTFTMPSMPEDEEGELPADYERLWKAANDNPNDFTSWTDLLQYCEQESHMMASRRALEAFLARYPLCYGYWKKYADLERRSGYNDKAQAVCVQGLQAIPLSVDLWIHYINLLLGTLDMNLPDSPDRIRSVFEGAVAAAGADFHSDRLWDLYVEWEKEQGNMRAARAVLDRVLSVPTQLYSSHYDKFKAHLNGHEPKEVLSAEEYEELRTECRQSQKAERAEQTPEDIGERPPGEEEPATPEGQDSEELMQKIREQVVSRRDLVYQHNEGEVRKRWHYEDAIKRPYFHVKPLDRVQLRAWHTYLDWEVAQLSPDTKDLSQEPAETLQDEDTKDLSQGQDTKDLSQGEDTKDLSQGEDTKDLSQGQDTKDLSQGEDTKDLSQGEDTKDLSQGEDTKDLSQEPIQEAQAEEVSEVAPPAQEIPDGSSVVSTDDHRVRILFERCLIACALYEEFWTRYVQYLEPHSVEEARATYRRACLVHLTHKHTLHMHWATFEERHGDLTEARRVLEALETTVPGLAAVRLRRAALERRAGQLDRSEALLREAVAESREKPALHAFYSIKLARLLLKLGRNPSKARAALHDALEISPDNGKLYMNLLELEASGDPRSSAGAVQECVSRALAAPLSPRTKTAFSQRGMQYAEDYSTSIQSVLAIYQDHQRLLEDLNPKKRCAENGDDEAEKLCKVDDGSAIAAGQQVPPTMPHVPITTPPPPVMGADASAQGAYGAYSSWYQQPQYGSYGYQNTWNYNQGYYPPS